MILFSCLINFIEALFCAIFLAYYFELRSKRLYICGATLFVFCLLNYAQFIVNDSGLWLSFYGCLFYIVTLFIFEKGFKFEHVYITVLYHTFLIMCSFLSVGLISRIGMFFTLTDVQFTICICLLAKLLQVVITIYLLKKGIKLVPRLDLKKWNSILFIDIILLISLVVTEYAFLNEIGDSLIKFVLVGEFIIAILFRVTINQISKLNQDYLDQVRKQEQTKYIEKQLLLMKNIKNEISATDHRINYLLLQLRLFLKQNKIAEIEEFLERYTKIMFKYKLACDTGNVVFDCLVSLKINEMIMNQNLIESIFFIQKDDVYNDMNFVQMITNLLDFFKNCKNIYVSMQSFGEYLDIRIIYREGQIDANKLYMFLKSNFSDKDNLLNNDHAIKGVHLVVNMEKYYGKYDY